MRGTFNLDLTKSLRSEGRRVLDRQNWYKIRVFLLNLPGVVSEMMEEGATIIISKVSENKEDKE